MYRNWPLPGRIIALLLLLTAAVVSVQQTAVPHASAQEAPATCLSDDPYQLQDLQDILSSDTPPTAPVNVNRFLTVTYIGDGTLVDEEPTQPERDDTAGNTDPNEPAVDETDIQPADFLVFNSRTKFEFRVTMQAGLLTGIQDCYATNNLTDATEGVEEEPMSELTRLFMPFLSSGNPSTADGIQHGWSNGVDTRSRLSATQTWPWRTIAQFRSPNSSSHNSNCSGTLIGPRHIITAAHCINAQGTSNWFTQRITPGKNGLGTGATQEPYGSSVVSPNPAPGEEVWYFTPWQWRNPDTTHWQWDWGLLVIPDRLGDQTGWMGYVSAPGSYLQNVNKWNRGYAQCNTARGNSPANCVNGALYGDVNACNIGSFLNMGGDGWNRRITVSCDMSGGHSGSAVYYYYFSAQQNRWVPVVTMVTSTESCATCNANTGFPNGMVRLTPSRISVISWLRETFP